MLNRYNDFIFESLMLESILVYSDDFKNILNTIDSPVSQALLDAESKDLTLANNYIDLADNKEEISFINDKKAQKILSPDNLLKYCYHVGDGGFLKHSESNQEIFDLLEYVPEGDKCYHPQVDEKGEVLKRITSPSTGTVYLKIKFTGGISVINENKVRYEDVNNLPFTTNRQKIRVGRGVRGILSSASKNFPDAQIEEFVNKYKSAIDQKNDIFKNFQLIKGDEIGYWYDVNNYQLGHSKGTLSTSCMRSVPSRYFQIYSQNPDVCQLLILKTDDGKKIKGRALVWNLKSPQGITYMDRTYVHEDSDFELFRQYAQKQGWYRKPNNDHWVTSDMVDPQGNKVSLGELVVQVQKGEYSYYPYLDTLKYYNIYKGTLSTDEGDTIELSDTGGSYVGGECDYCGGEGTVDCPDCGGDGEVNCGDCDGEGEVDCSSCDGEGDIECQECWGEGKIECSDCDGDGEIECSDCDGEGVDEEGEECETCEGKGKVECEECESEGKVECQDCSGRGSHQCEDCDGRGKEECGECSGSGTENCDYCSGDGTVDCPECN